MRQTGSTEVSSLSPCVSNLFLLVRPLSSRALAAGRSGLAAALGGWFVPALIGVVQVAVMLGVTTFALDITPAHGLATAAFLVLDDLCAEYAALTDQIEDELEEIERQVYDDAVVESRTRIYRLRQQIGKAGRAVASLARSLESSHDHFLSVSVAGHEVEPYVRDLLDRLTGTAEVLHDQSSTLDAVVASHENNSAARQNDDVRRISAIAALLSVPALTAGIFGMNFGDLPLVKTPLGWVWVLGAAALVDVVVVLLFRRRRWL